MGQLKRKLDGSTLIEVIVAMMIVAVVSAMLFTLINQLMQHYNPYMKVRARLMLEKNMEAQETHSVTDTKKSTKHLIFEKEIEAYKPSFNLYVVYYRAFDKDGQILAMRKRIEYIQTEKILSDEK